MKISRTQAMASNCSIIQRGKKGTFHLRITYPTRLQRIFGQKQLWRSLDTTDSATAHLKAVPLIKEYVKRAQASAYDDPSDPQHIQNAAVANGFDYLTDDKLTSADEAASVELLSSRFEAWERLQKKTEIETIAIAGSAKETLSLDKMFERYQELAAGKWADLDNRARDKKWNRYAEPVADFKKTMGNKDVLLLKPKDAFDYAAKLGKRIEAKKLKSETAKKKLLFLSAMVRKVFQSDYPDLNNPFEAATIDYEGDSETRKPFTEEEVVAVRKTLAASDANEELKAVCTIMELTGAHAKEIVLIHEDDIHLDAPISFISIRRNANRAKLKTGGARTRDIALLPDAVAVFRQFPKGFPRYCRSGGSEALTQAANKIIQTAAPGKTTYSFRHLMVDRLREADVQDSLLMEIIGHNGGQTADYGKGHSLEKKFNALKKAFKIKTE